MKHLTTYFILLCTLSMLLNVQARLDPIFAFNDTDRLQSYLTDFLHNSPIISIKPELFFRYRSREPINLSPCKIDIEILTDAISTEELWAIKTLDAWGKPLPSGIFKGNLLWLGNYDECVDNLYQQNNQSYMKQPIDTQYCAIHAIPTPPVEVRSGLILGICVPASCNRLEILELLTESFNLTDFTKENLHCSNDRNNEENKYLTGTIVFIVFLSIIVSIVMFGTILDLISMNFSTDKRTIDSIEEKNHELSIGNELSISDHKSKFSKFNENSVVIFIKELSALRTIKRILEINRKQNENNFGCLDGIRVLSLFWVISVHSFSSGIYYTSNMLDILSGNRNFLMQLINGGPFAVDTFFVLSGFLTTVLFVRQVKKEPLSFKMMALYYIHRYIRLTPSFILVIFVSIYLTPYFGRGPLYPIQQGIEPVKCRDGNWWSAFLYVGNFLKSEDLCNGITWYLYNDMQFYWIAPLALIPFVKGKKIIGYIITIMLIFVSIFSTLGILLRYPRLAKDDPDNPTNETLPISFDIIYMKPYCRVAPYAIGMLTGFIISQIGRHYPIKRIPLIIGNVLAVFLGFACLFGNYGNQFFEARLSRSSNTAYMILSRPAWGLFIAWVIFVCSIHRGGIVNRFLSSPVWAPFVRVNYAAYLIHMVVILITILNLSNPSYYQFITCLNSYVSQLFFSYLAAVPVVIFFETPFFFLEKKIFKR